MLPTQIRVVQATENLQRLDLTHPEIYRLCTELMDLNPDWQRTDLAAHLGKHPSTITQYLSPGSLIPEALQAFLDGKFGFSLAYKISIARDQAAALACTLKGGTRSDLEDAARSQRNGHGQGQADTKKLPSIRITLPGELVVTIKGPELNLARSQDALKAAVKEVEFAKSQNLNAKTAQSAWKDRAKPKPVTPDMRSEITLADAGGGA